MKWLFLGTGWKTEQGCETWEIENKGDKHQMHPKFLPGSIFQTWLTDTEPKETAAVSLGKQQLECRTAEGLEFWGQDW